MFEIFYIIFILDFEALPVSFLSKPASLIIMKEEFIHKSLVKFDIAIVERKQCTISNKED